MQKAHQNVNWQNLPSTNTPLNQTNLNSMDQAIDVIDDRVVTFDTSKANQTDMLQAVKNITLDKPSGVLTVTFFNNTSAQINTGLEKIAVNFTYDSDPTSPNYQKIIITLDDGSVELVDLTALVTQYEFDESPTIMPTIFNGRIQMGVKDGSITGNKLQPNYLADITVEAGRATGAASSASDSAVLSESWAEGGTGTREGEDTANAKYYAQAAADTVASLLAAFGLAVVGERLVFGANFEEQYNVAVSNTMLVFTEVVPNP